MKSFELIILLNLFIVSLVVLSPLYESNVFHLRKSDIQGTNQIKNGYESIISYLNHQRIYNINSKVDLGKTLRTHKQDLNVPLRLLPKLSSVDPSPILNGVRSIVALGVPGPLWALNPTPVPIVAGDNDTTPIPSVVAMASGLGRGRVVAVGHEAFFTNDALYLLDNKQFGLNIVNWLNEPLHRYSVLVTTGHEEWFGGSNFDNFKAELESHGYTVTRYSGIITPSVLSNISVVIIGNMWGEVLDSEIEALREFVDGGGGLFLIGLGWSWLAYRGPLDEYPMNRVAEPYGVRWIDGYITDPTNSYNGHPIFHTFYPSIKIQTLYQAFSFIKETTAEHPIDLPDILQSNESLRRDYINAHLLIATGTRDLCVSSHQRHEIYYFYRDLINNYTQYFKKNIVYDTDRESAIAWIRERIYRSFIDALPLTEMRKAEIAVTINLTGRYLDIWEDFTVLILDNTRLGENELDFIYDLLSLMPSGIHNVRAISVADYLGEISPDVPLQGINIFGINIGDYSENPFPDDVSPNYVDVFCIVVIHEMNHGVDAYYIQNNESLRSRRDMLINQAGHYHLNYLRSMFPDGFFLNAPQEFFASISNQWFTNSCKTIELGLARFDKGYKDPINQALFFADVYSMGRDFTYFYYTDVHGNIIRQKIPVLRDDLGRIVGLIIGDYLYSFTLDENGSVIEYSIEPLAAYSLSDFPTPFTLEGEANVTFVIGETREHGVFGFGARTIDVLGAIGIAYTVGLASSGGVCDWLVDTDFTSVVGDRVEVDWVEISTRTLILVGGPGVNMLAYYYNGTCPFVWRYVPGVKSCIYSSLSGEEYYCRWAREDYAIVQVFYDTSVGKYILIIWGLTGYGSQAACLVLQYYTEFQHLLQGEAVIIRWEDVNRNGIVDLKDSFELIEWWEG